MNTLTDPRPQLAAQRRQAIDYLADLGVIRRQVFATWPADEAEAKVVEVDADIAACEAIIDALTDQCCERFTPCSR